MLKVLKEWCINKLSIIWYGDNLSLFWTDFKKNQNTHETRKRKNDKCDFDGFFETHLIITYRFLKELLYNLRKAIWKITNKE